MVETRALTRRFDDRVAVDGLTLDVGAGEVVSLLGPNGAGQTTTFRMLAALLMPTSGEATIAGTRLTPSSADATRSRVGLLTEAPGLWERLSVRRNLLTYADLHGVTDSGARVAAVMDAVGIADRADDRAGALSKGLKQRVALARAVVHDPQVVLLDEPTSGLDPASARQVRNLIRQLRGDGRAVLVSTHNLSEAEELSDRIAVLNARLLAFDTPRRLREERRAAVVAIEVEGEATAWLRVAAQLEGTSATADGAVLTLRVPDHDSVPDIVAALVAAGARVRRVEPTHATLEDAYLALVRDDG
ncbi:MAG: ABC transporter ATP-binding protein [Acidobacteria bacterium]|nr:ABC transporter ATP-binding protein [Acidobacteriota bacterium]